MKHLAILLCVVVILTFESIRSDPQDKNATDHRQSSHFEFETENGQVRDEQIDVASSPSGSSKDSKTDDDSVNVKGSYSFISADGYEYTVTYRANKNGYQPFVTARKVGDDAKN